LRSLVRVGVSAGVLGAILWPLQRPVLEDGFPLSTYPMFVQDRSTVKLYRAVGLDDQAAEHILPPRLIVGDDQEPMLAAITVEREMRRGQARRAELCAQIARAAREDPDFSELLAIELRIELHDPIAYFEGAPGEGLLEGRTQTHCKLRPAETSRE